MTKFKDVAHLYLGCEIEWGFDGRKKKGELVGKDERYGWQVFDPSNVIVPYHQCRIELIKPLLRPLDSMTKEEVVKFFIYKGSDYSKVFTRTSVEDNFIQIEYKCAGEYLSDYQVGTFLNAAQFTYLLSIGVDLFSLIPNNEAIDKTKTQNNG